MEDCMKILIGTQNPAKIREFKQMLGAEGVEWMDLSQLPDAPQVEETGETFEANARLKAAAYARRYGVWAVADDSGLEVDALEGRPGVYSARWAAMHDAGRGDEANNLLLLKQLEGLSAEERGARFVCVLALADAAGRIVLTARETVGGRITDRPRGERGFGYDPLFLVPERGKTTAELSPAEKHAISHRGKALRRLREEMTAAGLVLVK
jgi:XTP/dITP diphosphohydrolase